MRGHPSILLCRSLMLFGCVLKSPRFSKNSRRLRDFLNAFQLSNSLRCKCRLWPPNSVSAVRVQRAPKTHWFEGTRPQLQSLVLCLSCLAGLANSFEPHLALFRWGNHVSISVRKTEGNAPSQCLCRANAQ